MSPEAAPRQLEVEAAGLIRAALTGDEFTIDRIVTRAYETDLDWRSFANEVTYTAACLLIVASGSKAQATALADTWLDSLVRKRMAAASLGTRVRCLSSSRTATCGDVHSSISASAGASAAGVACASGWASACRLMRAAYWLRASRSACSALNRRAASSTLAITLEMPTLGSCCPVAGSCAQLLRRGHVFGGRYLPRAGGRVAMAARCSVAAWRWRSMERSRASASVSN